MSRSSHSLKRSIVAVGSLSLVLGGLTTSASAEDAPLVPHSLQGTFAESVDPPDSDPIYQSLANGTYDGIYFVPDGTFPAVSGSVVGLPEFGINLRDASGNVVIRYLAGSDFGAFYADFFGPGSGGTFVFAGSGTQFQVSFPSDFDGTGEAHVANGVFGHDPYGGIRTPSGTAKAGEVLDIDIRPYMVRNRVYPNSQDEIRVAILGSADFDVLDVDLTTLEFGPDGARPAREKGAHRKDANRDGFLDLVSPYRMPDSGIAVGDQEACVTAMTLDGRPLFGCDFVSTRPR